MVGCRAYGQSSDGSKASFLNATTVTSSSVGRVKYGVTADIACCDPRYFLQLKLESGLKEGPDDEAI